LQGVRTRAEGNVAISIHPSFCVAGTNEAVLRAIEEHALTVRARLRRRHNEVVSLDDDLMVTKIHRDFPRLRGGGDA
jgi:hypothetical protein